MRLRGVFLLSVIAAGLQAGCGGGSRSSTTTNTTTTTTTGNQGGSPSSQFAHIFIVIEENHSYNSVIGNSAMPYLNGLATANGLATQYYADIHPSLPNYFMLTTGATIASDDAFAEVVSQDNVVRALTAAGKTWKCYAEDLPSPGYLGGDVLPYAHHHNPFVYFSDVQNSSSEAANIVPMTQLAADISSNTLPDYAFIIPDLENDAHDCPPGMSACTDTQTLANADQWLATNFTPLLASSAFTNSLLIITFDEGIYTDFAPNGNGGGQVATVLVSPLVKPGYQSTTIYQHESTLRLMMEGLGVKDLPGAAATAPAMTEFFK